MGTFVHSYDPLTPKNLSRRIHLLFINCTRLWHYLYNINIWHTLSTRIPNTLLSSPVFISKFLEYIFDFGALEIMSI